MVPPPIQGSELDMEAVCNGELTPVFFGSGMNNFGVELFLKTFLGYCLKPKAHESEGELVAPDDEDFRCVFAWQSVHSSRRQCLTFSRVLKTFQRVFRLTRKACTRLVGLLGTASRPFTELVCVTRIYQ